MKLRGIVVKIKDSHCLVLASDGTYHKVPRSRHKGARVGGEIEFTLNNWLQYVKPALLVASILLVVLGISMFQQSAIPPAFAYVSMDINPSIELALGPDLKVISAKPLNKDAEKLLTNVDISGKQLYASVNSILAEAVQEGFIKPGQKNYILSTVTLEKKASAANIDYEALAGEMRSAVQNKGVEVEFVVLATDSKLHQEAKAKGLSTGKLAVYQQAVAAGENVTLEQVRDNSLTNLVNEYKIKLVPADKNIIIKSLEIKPHDNDEDRHQNLEKSNGPQNEDTDKDFDQDKPHLRGNPHDNKQVFSPAVQGPDNGVDIDFQTPDEKNGSAKDSKNEILHDNKKDEANDNNNNNVKDRDNDNSDKDSKNGSNSHMTIKDDYSDTRSDSNGSTNGNNNISGNTDEKKNDVVRDNKSESDQGTPEKNNSQQNERNSEDKSNSQRNEGSSGDKSNSQQSERNSAEIH